MNKEIRKHSAKTRFYIFVCIFLLLFIFSIYLHSIGVGLDDIKKIPQNRFFPIIFIFVYATISFLPIPFTPTSFLGGIFFPFYQALIYTLLGSLLFATLLFYITRFLGKDYVQYWIHKNERFHNLESKLEKRAFFQVFMLRLFFVIPSEFINVVSGLSNIKYRDFILATFVANTITLIFSVGLVRGQIKHDYVSLVASVLGLIICLIIPILFVSKFKKVLRNEVGMK